MGKSTKRKTIEDAQVVASEHNGKFLSTVFTNTQKKHVWECKSGHVFEARYTDVSRGHWCNECTGRKRKTIEQARKLIESKGGALLSKEYKNSRTKLTIQCADGHIWSTRLPVITTGHWCPTCGGRPPLYIDDLRDVAIKKGGTCLTQVYTGLFSYYEWQCAKGHKWKATGASVRNTDTWCGICAKGNIEELEEYARSRNGTIVSSIYINRHTKYVWRCERDHQWAMTASNALATQGWCRSCVSEKVKEKTIKEYQQIALSRGGSLCEGEVYFDSKTKVSWKCAKGHIFKTIGNSVGQGVWCPSCSGSLSTGQNEILGFVEALGLEAIDRARGKPSRYEMDVYVPSSKLAIEYNGLYWHSSAGPGFKAGSHYKKGKALRDAGYSLLAIFEDEWRNKRALVEEMIRVRCGKFEGEVLDARSLKVVEISSKEAKAFCDLYHLDGGVHSKKAWGLTHNGELVACATLRVNFAGESELSRLAFRSGVRIRGGAGRLISRFPRPLVSFSNNRLSTGNVYQQLGFNKIQELTSSYWYTDLKQRIWRWKCKRINVPEILEEYPTEAVQTGVGLQSQLIFGDCRPLYRIEDYGHIKWLLP